MKKLSVIVILGVIAFATGCRTETRHVAPPPPVASCPLPAGYMMTPAVEMAEQTIQEQSRAIEAAGADLWYLPPYSPDLNPIEKLWAKVKAWLRRIGAKTFDTLAAAIGDALRAVQPNECQNYFKSCGYGDYLG